MNFQKLSAYYFQQNQYFSQNMDEEVRKLMETTDQNIVNIKNYVDYNSQELLGDLKPKLETIWSKFEENEDEMDILKVKFESTLESEEISALKTKLESSLSQIKNLESNPVKNSLNKDDKHIFVKRGGATKDVENCMGLEYVYEGDRKPLIYTLSFSKMGIKFKRNSTSR